jgi:CMP-N,N'-diacetyllegionaminic acid synthase
MTMEVLAVLPMRGGSKSIPKKSIYPVLGRPLAAYAMREAKKAKLISRFIAFTDDDEMAAVSKRFGFEVRTDPGASDRSTDVQTFKRLLEPLRDDEHYVPDLIVHLRAPAPLFNAEDIDSAIGMLLKNPDADSVRGLREPDLTPFKMYWHKSEGDAYVDYFLRDAFPDIFEKFPEPSATARQHFPMVWQHSAQIDVTRTRNILVNGSMSGRHILPFFVNKEMDVDIDCMEDIPYAEYLLRRYGREFN